MFSAAALMLGLGLFAQTPDLSLGTVVIDAGHGGKDAGTVSPDKKTYEKTLTLRLASLIRDSLSRDYPALNVVMTRSTDVFVPLSTRAKLATKAGGQLFISVHINAAARSRTARGFSAYILGQSASGKYDSYDVNMEVLRRENSVIYLEEDYSTKYKDYDSSPESQIMLQLMLNAYREQSLSFAQAVSEEMGGGRPFSKSLGVMQGNFAVLREASMPAVLLEFGYMSNPDDLAILRDHTKLEQMAGGVARAFRKYKKDYDASVSLKGETPAGTVKPEATATPAPTGQVAQPAPATTPAPQAQPAPAAAPAPQDQAAQPAPAGTQPSPAGQLYGTQVLTSSRLIPGSDPFFKGHEVMTVKVGTLYKYVLGVSSDRSKAAADHKVVKSQYPDSFFVRVEDGATQRERL